MPMDEPHQIIPPGSTIGILGGGQLGRMLVGAAARLGYRCHIFEPSEQCPAGDVARHTAAAWDDRGALERFAGAVDVVTLEFENVPVEAVDFLSGLCPVRPGGEALRIAQDRALEKAYLDRAGAATAPWRAVAHLEELESAVAEIGTPAILKTARFGYDGKGQIRIDADTNLAHAWAEMNGARCVLEGFVPFEREISVIAARTPAAEIVCYDPVENRHRDHILHKTIAPARLSERVAADAAAIARQTISGMDYVGLLAVEMFVLPDGGLVANEIAPRPHNSGHWTLDACATSQFEQTVRAVCGLPLGSVARLGEAEMTNLIGAEVDGWPDLVAEPGARVHLYGKAEIRPGRKMGHVTRVRPAAGT